MSKPLKTSDEFNENSTLNSSENVRQVDEEFLSAVIIASPNAIYVYDLTAHRFIYLNEQAEHLFGYSTGDAQTMTGESLRESIHPDDRRRLLRHFAGLRLSNNEDVCEIEFRLRHKNGEWRWLKSCDKVFRRAADKRVTQIAGYAEDITKRKNSQEELFRLAAIVESSGDAIFSNSFDGAILSWNKGAEHTFGYSAAEMVGRNFSLILPAEQYEQEQRIIEKINRSEPVEPFETILKKKDGADIPVLLTVSAIKNTGGEIIGISKIARNIGSYKQMAEALRQSEERYRAFIEQSSEGVWRFEINKPFSVELPVEEQIEQIY